MPGSQGCGACCEREGERLGERRPDRDDRRGGADELARGFAEPPETEREEDQPARVTDEHGRAQRQRVPDERQPRKREWSKPPQRCQREGEM